MRPTKRLVKTARGASAFKEQLVWGPALKKHPLGWPSPSHTPPSTSSDACFPQAIYQGLTNCTPQKLAGSLGRDLTWGIYLSSSNELVFLTFWKMQSSRFCIHSLVMDKKMVKLLVATQVQVDSPGSSRSPSPHHSFHSRGYHFEGRAKKSLRKPHAAPYCPILSPRVTHGLGALKMWLVQIEVCCKCENPPDFEDLCKIKNVNYHINSFI